MGSWRVGHDWAAELNWLRLPGVYVHGIFQARILDGLPFLSPGIFPTQGSNLSLLYWQVDSLPLFFFPLWEHPCLHALWCRTPLKSHDFCSPGFKTHSTLSLGKKEGFEQRQEREAWCAAVHEVSESQPWLSDWTTTIKMWSSLCLKGSFCSPSLK